MHTLDEEIELIVTELCECWTHKDLQAIRGLWDTDQAGPHLMPQEKDQPILSWPSFDDYLVTAEARLHRCSMRFWDLNVKPLGSDLPNALERQDSRLRKADRDRQSGECRLSSQTRPLAHLPLRRSTTGAYVTSATILRGCRGPRLPQPGRP